ncbi:SdpA family antimicrobial peptide system protein [Skermania sp. ID1734]|uniref:SdpA family antimicrobial peptide system protein n=1 Tax=Skermania sp. ID1734 TaxID=2597516 RepID=UPI00163D53CC|nr:SdpA family antimicrobial peptide system protein [Skermania sp. ID1734]
MVLVALWVAEAQLPANVLSIPQQLAGGTRALVHLFPQGWAFFTRTPREEQFNAYAPDGPRLVALDRTPHSEIRNIFGLNRRSRKQLAELTLILDRVTDKDWQSCTASDLDCFRSLQSTTSVDNPQPFPNYCGTVIVIGREMVPWAYRQMTQSTLTNKRVVRLDVHCKAK